ncbi:DUF4479 and tRNA-binding domain-containing protein [Lentilactobacillus senioris]|uniref:YtpR family tRNA-binding protein n=1 Tax=Lentilactobacillus senioris TaxID=931534 RepID=UPI00228153AA|nr:DUF4479 and tRNA-binding domain-containing protein [Lentilactobacillus senioris]MCY9806968.1 DUF4479 and tRNA-binding domain-containing protein [Lentilactobacillus senioris]
MLIASYNAQTLGDTLVVIMGQDVEEQRTEIRDNVAQIIATDSGETIGVNFLAASEILPEIKDNQGQIELSADQVNKLNAYLSEHQFEFTLHYDDDPKFVVGYVESMTAHPDSDHLNVTLTEVNNGEKLQIVSGSPNMQAGIKVVVAKVGAMMPNGQIIWPGELRGVESFGMICSGRELKIPNSPQVPGALILPEDGYQVGEPFDFTKAQHLFD